MFVKNNSFQNYKTHSIFALELRQKYGKYETFLLLKKPRRNKLSEFMRQEEQDSKNNFSKGDRDIEDSGDENIIASAVNSNNTPWCKEHYASTAPFQYFKLETFDTFYDDCKQLKYYIYDILKFAYQ